MTLTPFLMLLLLAGGHALFFALALLSRRAPYQGERWLAVIMGLLAVGMAAMFFYESGLYQRWPALIGLDAATEYLYGPLLWLFIRRAAGEPRLRATEIAPHLLPFLALNILTVLALSTLPDAERIALIDTDRAHVPESWEFDLFAVGMLVQAAFYLWQAWRCLWRYQATLEQEYADLKVSNLPLLRNVLWTFDVLWVVALIVGQLSPLLGWSAVATQILSGAVATVVFALGLFVLRHPPLRRVLASPPADAPPFQPADAASAQSDDSPRKYARSALDDAAAHLLFGELDARMRAEAFWKDPDLDLSSLAERSGWSAHYLSQAINCGAQCNFNDYINRYRIQAVQQRLSDLAAHETVLGIALQAGFNSKSAFYTAFKRHTGLSPKAFQQRQTQTA